MTRSITSIQKESAQITTVADLTSVFEGIASMRIAKVKDKVTRSSAFFAELWQIYTQLRVDPSQRLTQGVSTGPVRDKPGVYVVLTSEGSLSGDIDTRIVEAVASAFNPATTDLIVIGAHGARQFSDRHLPIKRYFRLPDVDQEVDASPIVTEIAGYQNASVWFQRYVSLTNQEPGRIDLLARVRTLASDSEAKQDIISPRSYLFEPGVEEVVQYLESVMVGIALSQVILESRLAQYASRFTAMSAAKKRALDIQQNLAMAYSRARRAAADDEIKETLTSLRVFKS